MKKRILSLLVLGSLSLALVIVTSGGRQAEAATDTATLSTTVQEYLTFSLTAGDTVSFGTLTPGTPICYSTGTVASVTTNASNGYTLGVSDGIASTNSSMVHTDAATYIPDMTNGTIATPVLWSTKLWCWSRPICRRYQQGSCLGNRYNRLRRQ